MGIKRGEEKERRTKGRVIAFKADGRSEKEIKRN